VRVFAFGTGPGPKNVGIEFDDGTRTVVAYRTFKYKYKPQIGGSLSDKVYAGASGIVQFDPRVREANGKTVTDVTIKANGSQKLINITIWPEFQLTQPVKKGDFISADGEFQSRVYQAQDGSQREGLSISPTSLVHVPCVPKMTTQVVQAQPVAVAAQPVAQVVQAQPVATQTQAIPF